MDQNTHNPDGELNEPQPPKAPTPFGVQPEPTPEPEPQQAPPADTQSAHTPPPAEPQAGMGALSQDSKNLAMLCHLLGFLTCFLGPLILWLIKKDNDAFVDSQGKEALNFQITVAIVATLLSVTCIGVPLLPLVGVADLVFCILACVAASKGEDYHYPVCIRLVK